MELVKLKKNYRARAGGYAVVGKSPREAVQKLVQRLVNALRGSEIDADWFQKALERELTKTRELQKQLIEQKNATERDRAIADKLVSGLERRMKAIYDDFGRMHDTARLSDKVIWLHSENERLKRENKALRQKGEG